MTKYEAYKAGQCVNCKHFDRESHMCGAGDPSSCTCEKSMQDHNINGDVQAFDSLVTTWFSREYLSSGEADRLGCIDGWEQDHETATRVAVLKDMATFLCAPLKCLAALLEEVPDGDKADLTVKYWREVQLSDDERLVLENFTHIAKYINILMRKDTTA